MSDYANMLTSLGGGAPNMVNPNNGDAHSIAANLIQSQYTNWQQNFQPIELATLQQSSLNNSGVVGEQVNNAIDRANMSAANMEGVGQRQLSRMGVQATDQQQAVSARLLNLSRAGAVAGAENSARANVAKTDEIIATGGIPAVAK